MPEYKRFDEKVWLGFGKSLLNEKGSEKQQEFLRACRLGKDAFLEYLQEPLLCVENNTIDGDIVTLDYKFCEKEFCHPPESTEQIIWDAFKRVPDEITSYCGFWGHMIISMIQGDYITPGYLASELNGITNTGIYMIDVALKSDNEETTDRCVRRILRSMCHPTPRGKRIVFNDFYLGKAYWRWCWSHRMSTYMDDLEFEQILRILNAGCYGGFSAKMHTGKSYISSKNVLGGLLLYLKGIKKDEKITGEKLEKIIDKISYLSAWKAIEIQTPELNQGDIEIISKTVL